MNACRSPGPLALRLAPLSLWERLEVGAIAMSIITRYVPWVGHDAGGTLPPLDVVAGIVRPGAWRLPQDWPPLTAGEALVFVPPQWIGDWETGHALAPAYHYLWRVSHAELRPLLMPRRYRSIFSPIARHACQSPPVIPA